MQLNPHVIVSMEYEMYEDDDKKNETIEDNNYNFPYKRVNTFIEG